MTTKNNPHYYKNDQSRNNSAPTANHQSNNPCLNTFNKKLTTYTGPGVTISDSSIEKSFPFLWWEPTEPTLV